MKKRREVRLDSAVDKLYVVEKFVEEISDEFYLNDNYYGNILIALTEAYRNAVIHGNRSDRNKTVELSLETGADGLRFEVSDQGEGFDFASFTDREKLLYQPELKGKGILMILSLADEVEFKNGGKTVSMLFRIHGIDENIVERRSGLMKEYYGTGVKVKKEDDAEEYQ